MATRYEPTTRYEHVEQARLAGETETLAGLLDHQRADMPSREEALAGLDRLEKTIRGVHAEGRQGDAVRDAWFDGALQAVEWARGVYADPEVV